MALILSSAGSYPRIGDSPELQVLRRTIAAVDRGERTPADLSDAEAEMTRRAIEEQVRSSIELLTDGLIRWYDPISHLAGKLSNIQIKGLLRFFDTNTYFRQPVLSGCPARTGPLVVDEFLLATNALGSMPTPDGKAGRLGIKPVLTGPYTLAKFSITEDGSMRSLEARVTAYAEALAAEIRALADVGALFIQIDEPAIIKFPQDWDVFSLALNALAIVRQDTGRNGKPVKIELCVYFHDCAPLYEKLADLPVDVLGLDFTYNARLVDVVSLAGAPMPLALGLVDGRNTKLEDVSTVARQVEKLLPRIAGGVTYLSTSCGLEYLPRDHAFAKLQLLARIQAAVEGQRARVAERPA